MKQIPLTQGQFTLVDDADYEWLSAFKWCALQTTPGVFYAVRGCGPQTSYMHRAILPGFPEVDHRNRRTLDNQRHNLRPATHAQNLHNLGISRHNTSGFKGVCWDRARGKWKAQITVADRNNQLGRFSTAEEAARAYDSSARLHFGEFAYLNFP